MNGKSMYLFDCMIFNPAGGCWWKYWHTNKKILVKKVMEHLIKENKTHSFSDDLTGLEIRINSSIIKTALK